MKRCAHERWVESLKGGGGERRTDADGECEEAEAGEDVLY